MSGIEEIILELHISNERYAAENACILSKYCSGQHPHIAVLSCSDSRVIPEFIFKKEIGELFVIRVAGNVAMDSSVIASLEYAIEHLNVRFVMILGHSQCGAVHIAEATIETDNPLLLEIKQSFSMFPTDHIRANIYRQLHMLPKRSHIIKDAIQEKKLTFVGAIYSLDSGTVEFLE